MLLSATVVAAFAFGTAPAASQPTGVLFGRYEGTLPCADCGGIRTELVLHAESPNGPPTTYEMSETYLGTGDGDRTFRHAGRWTIVRGAPGDPDATVYRIALDERERARSYRLVSEGELRLLDGEQKEIASTRPYSLYRKDPPARVVVSDADSGGEVELAIGQELVVRLTASRVTGLSWARQKAEGSVLELSGEPDYVPNTGMGVVGSAGVEIFRFKGARAGHERLAFDYRRPLLRDQAPSKTVWFEVKVR